MLPTAQRLTELPDGHVLDEERNALGRQAARTFATNCIAEIATTKARRSYSDIEARPFSAWPIGVYQRSPRRCTMAPSAPGHVSIRRQAAVRHPCNGSRRS
jgi:hypothetical protein